MNSVGTVIDGNEKMEPSVSLQEARKMIKQIGKATLFELAWEAYSKEWDHGYAWFNLNSGNVECGHERIAEQKYSYLILLKVCEEDFEFEWDPQDEFSEYEKFKDRLSTREWCDLKSIDYRERIKTGVLYNPQKWGEYNYDSKISLALYEWYRKHDVTEHMEYSKQSSKVNNKERIEQMGESKKKDYFLRDFKTLTLYKKAVELEDMIDKLAESFPHDEKYRLTDQLIRCVTSIGANVAESNGGQYAGRERYHLGVAFSSANEVRYWVERAFRRSYITEVMYKRLDEMAQELRRIMVGMFKRLDGLND